jgi:hypothetical protein
VHVTMVTDQDNVGEKAAEGGASLLDAGSVHASPSFLTTSSSHPRDIKQKEEQQQQLTAQKHGMNAVGLEPTASHSIRASISLHSRLAPVESDL